MNRSIVICLAAAFVISLAVWPVYAQDGRHLELESLVEVVREVANAQGDMETVIEPAERILPGETIVFGTVFKNVGEDPAENIILTNPVPENTSYIGESADGEGTVITFSVDGGQTYDTPGNLTITDRDGNLRPALPEEYTHIRWTLDSPLAPGQSGKVSFRAVLQ